MGPKLLKHNLVPTKPTNLCRWRNSAYRIAGEKKRRCGKVMISRRQCVRSCGTRPQEYVPRPNILSPELLPMPCHVDTHRDLILDGDTKERGAIDLEVGAGERN